MRTNEGAVERYLASRTSRLDPVQNAINPNAGDRLNPVVVVVKETAPERVDQSGLIFVLFLCLVGVALIAMFIVACHETPQVHETVNIPNCQFLC